MQEDVVAIKSWAAIFKDPAALRKKVTRNLALHGLTIRKDIK